MDILSSLIDASKLAGWARALVSSLLGVLIAKWPGLSGYFDPTTQAAIGTAVAGIIVGIWSQLAKSSATNVAVLAANNPQVEKVVMKSQALANSIPSDKVVSK
jgi:hypothetical protein